MDLLNRTPFAAERFIFLDRTGLETLLVIVKATFALRGATTAIAEEQEPIVVADEYRGSPARSSLRCASDLAPFKPATEIVARGSAYTGRSPRTEALVVLEVGPLQKAVQVIGDRVWTGGLVTGISDPKPFLQMELTYERAFGGTDDSDPGHVERCEQNPVGVGFRASNSRLPIAGSPLPNLEDPRDLIRSPKSRPAPHCFGPLAPQWRPRAQFAGTLDPEWKARRFPLLPADFDDRFHLTAPADQVYPGYVRGGEPVSIRGATPEGALSLSLPVVRPEVAVSLGRSKERPPCPCDTVILDCEKRALTLLWRARLVVQGRTQSLKRIEIRSAKDGGGEPS